MKLYFMPGAYSLAPHIALREANLPFALVEVDYHSRRIAGDHELSLADWPALQRHFAEISARRAVREALAGESLA